MNMRSFSVAFPAVNLSPDERRLIAGFVEAVAAGKSPDASVYLSSPELLQATPDLLTALACAEIEHRLTPLPTAADNDVTCDLRTLPRPVQQWPEVFPKLAESPACLVEVILADYLLRRSTGEVELNDYRQTFPQLADRIWCVLDAGSSGTAPESPSRL